MGWTLAGFSVMMWGMNQPPLTWALTWATTRKRLVGVGALLGLLFVSGCGAPNRHRIETGNLTATPPGGGTIELAPRIDVGATGGESPNVARVVDAESARGGVGSIRVTSGEPEQAMFVVTDDPAQGPSARAVVDHVMIDSVVGQINGRPVFASDFFEPMDARLAAEAKTLTVEEWLAMAQGEIRGRLRDMVYEELLLAEFESGLSIEQRSGLLFFVSTIRQNLVSASRGSEEILTRKLHEEEGVTIDEKVDTERRKAFIREHLRNELGDKAYVPWRDVLLQYKQDEALYNPAPTAHLRMIQISAGDTEAVARVISALESGESFEAVARRESTFRKSKGGVWDIELTGETYETSMIFGPPELNAAAAQLGEGEVSAPVETSNGKIAWIKLESVESGSISLYEAQFAIHNALRNQRMQEERSKYLQGLINRSSLSPLQDMESRLLEIASTRYLIDETP